MLSILFKDAIETVTHRIGTYVGSVLTTLGMASDDIATIQAAIPVMVGFVADMVLRKKIRLF